MWKLPQVTAEPPTRAPLLLLFQRKDTPHWKPVLNRPAFAWELSFFQAPLHQAHFPRAPLLSSLPPPKSLICWRLERPSARLLGTQLLAG